MKINKKLSIAALALFMSVASYAPVNAQDVSVDAVVASARAAAGVWEHSNGEWSYVVNGVEQTGWIVAGGAWYYLNDNGVMATGWALVDGTWYYLNANGSMATGWTVVNGSWYYLNNSGEMQTGWTNVEGTWYYLDANGAMATGWLELDGTWYFLKDNGSMAKGWVLDNGAWFFLKADGSMATEWLFEDRNWYYLDLAGRMLTDTTIGDWVIGADGVATEVVKSSQELLLEAIAAGKKIDKATDYRDDLEYKGTFDKFKAALEGAEKVSRDVKATDAQRNTAREKLENAMGNLVPTNAAKTDLIAQIRIAEGLTKGDYIPEAWAEFQTAVAKAKAVYADTTALLSTVEAATEALEEAIDEVNNHKKLNALGALDAAINAAEAIQTAEDERIAGTTEYGKYINYTSLTYVNLIVALDAAKYAFDNHDGEVANEEKLVEAKENLDAAIKGLKFAGIHTAVQVALTEELTDAREANHVAADYTKSSWARYVAALEAAQAVANNPVSNSEIENAMVSLDEAINGSLLFEGLVNIKQLKADIHTALGYKELGQKHFAATDKVWADFLDTLVKAEIVSENSDAKKEEVRVAQTDLAAFNVKLDEMLEESKEAAEEAGKVVIAKEQLKAIIDLAIYVEADLDGVSVKTTYLSAVAAANLAFEDGTDADGEVLTAAEIDVIKTTLNTQIGLVATEILDNAKASLNIAVTTLDATTKGYVKGDLETVHVAEWAAYETAFNNAKALNDKINAETANEVDLMVGNIKQMTALLVGAEADLDAVVNP